MNTTLHTLHGAMLQGPLPMIDNPIDGMIPSFNFGAAFNTWWKQVFAAIWGIVIIICLVYGVMAIVQMRSSNGNPMQHQQGKSALIVAGIALGCSVGFGVLVSAVFVVFS